MTTEELSRRLDAEGVVTLTPAEWGEIAREYEDVERHRTLIAGDLLVARGPGGLVAVEEPSAGERAVRRLTDAAAVRRFVDDRLETYERMWDGCGCKVEYYR